MSRKDAREKTSLGNKWKIRLTLALGAVAVIAACFAIRQFWGPGSASADAPYRRAAVAQPSGNTAPPIAAPPISRSAENGPMATGDTRTINVMAVVNGEQITRNELALEAARRYGEEVLEQMVNKQLILNVCQQRGIVITQQDINDEISRFAKKFNHTTDQWLELLRRERNLTPRQYASDIIWPSLALRQLVANKIEVTREEIDEVLEAELGAKVKVRLITVKSRQLAEQIHQQAVANPNDFGRLAIEYSEDKTSAAARGLIPPIRRHVGDPQIEQVAFALQQDEVSDVIQVADQFIILQCVGHIPATYIDERFQQAAEDRIVEHLKQKKLQGAAENLFTQMQREVNVVNVFNNPGLREQMPGIAATVGNTQITNLQLSEECISRHGLDVLHGEINRKLLMQELARKNLNVEQEEIEQEVARAAESYGHFKEDGTVDIDAWLKRVTEDDNTSVELYVRDAVWPSVALKKLVHHTVVVDDEDLQKGYEANYGPRVEVLAIVLDNQRQAQQVWDLARKTPTAEAFGELAYQFSIEPVSRENYGRVPPIQKHGGRPQIEEEAFKLQPGQLSGLISADDKWIVMRCIGHTKPVGGAEFAAVRSELEKDLFEKKLRVAMAKEFDRLKDVAQIDNFIAGTSQSGRRTAERAEESPRTRVPFTPASTGSMRLDTPPLR